MYMCLLQLGPEMIALSEEMAHDEYKPSSLKFFSDVAVVSNFPVCQVSTTPMQHMPIDIHASEMYIIVCQATVCI